MKPYYRAIPHWGPGRPVDALTLAGGWCWFDHCEVLTRDGNKARLHVGELHGTIRDRLVRQRPSVAGVAMDAPQIMGILNVTPDSFSDGGQFTTSQAAMGHVATMVATGATIIDIGGESTRPGAVTVDVAREIERTAPVVAAIRAQHDVAISIDTRKAAVARAAIEAGATLINDVAAFTFDPDLAQVAADAGLCICLMHAQGDPATMQQDPHYDDVLLDVYDFLEDRIAVALAAGITPDRIIVDPGIGFGKTLSHNLALLRGLSLFHSLGCPILLGASRKRFIGTLGGGQTAADRMAGSVAVAQEAVRQGVQILRVHDTFETRQALDLAFAINGAGNR